jgi:hypothetical protein
MTPAASDSHLTAAFQALDLTGTQGGRVCGGNHRPLTGSAIKASGGGSSLDAHPGRFGNGDRVPGWLVTRPPHKGPAPLTPPAEPGAD